MSGNSLKKMAFILIILVGLILPSGIVLSEDYSSSGVDITVFGDKTVFVNQTLQYEVKISGPFGKDADNWTLHASVKGKAKVSPEKKESTSSNTFVLNLTVQQKDSIKLILEAYCGKDDKIRYKKESLEIKAINTATVVVTVDNPKNMTLENIQVGLFIDTKLVKITTIEKLEPYKEKKVMMNYSKEGLSKDRHELDVCVDYGFDGSPSFFKNDRLLREHFYISEESDDSIYGWIIGLAAVAGIVLFLFYRQRRKKKRRPW